MHRLSNKTALITGGAGAIGRAAAKLFVQEGAKVVLVDVKEPAVQHAVQSLGSGTASHVVADVTQSADTQRYVQTALERHGSDELSGEGRQA